MRIGAQFFTLREFCQTPEGIAESLKKVADIGYRFVQISGTCAYDPAWLKEQLDQNGLTCVLTHIPQDRLIADAAAVARDHDVFECDHVGLGMFTFADEDGKRLSDFMNTFAPVARTLKENGKYFMYHNHAQEFSKENGVLIMEQLAQLMPADQMGFTLDTFWVQTGGGDPAWWLEHLKGRVPCIHLKDYAYANNERKMAPVGEGNINFERVFEKAEVAGTQYMLVEQDNCNGEDPFDCLARSYAFLKANGFN